MEDFSRFYAVPPLSSAISPTATSYYDHVISQLSSQCWTYYENSGNRHRHTLYLGILGPCVYVRYCLARSLSWVDDKENKLQLLNDAAAAADNVLLESSTSGCSQRITLLEGGLVGALALSAAIHYSLQAVCGETSLMKVSQAKNELLEIGRRYVTTLPEEECEVLYGRAGYLHAILLVRNETNDPEFGRILVRSIVQNITKEGVQVASESDTDLPLLWTWHNKKYLGAIHGVSGILFTLLNFQEEVPLATETIDKIKTTTSKLDQFCFASGNLKSSLSNRTDRLVHLCHGAPGHILYLVKAYEVLGDQKYLERAEEIATNVICRRGLLKKGVGLCHGISGNAYCFLALYRGRKLSEQRGGGDTSNAKSNEWLRWAHHFAHFAIKNLNALHGIPDHPYSLYEGVSGLIMLLHDLKDPDNSRFPCFEH